MARELMDILAELAAVRAKNDEKIRAAGLGAPKYEVVESITPNNTQTPIKVSYSPDFTSYRTAYDYDPAVSEEDRAREEWLQKNTFDWDINQANERANFGTMDDNEISTYNKLFNTVGKNVADSYYEEIKPELEYRRDYGVDYSRKMEETQKTLSDLAKEYASRPDYASNNQLRQEDRDRANFISNGFRDLNQSVDDTYRNLLTDEENEVYNYLLNTQGRDKAEEYYQTALPVLKHRATTNNAKWWEEEGEKHPYSTTAATVLMNIEKPFEWANQAGQFISGQNIDHTDLKNNMVSTGVKYGRKGVGNYITSGNFLKDELVKRGISEETAERMLESDPELVKNIGEAANFLYGTGASMADFLFNMALGNLAGGVYGASAEGIAKAQKVAEAFSLAVMGTGAASDATLEARERGLDSNQAFLLGSIAGLAEILTEKVSLETLLDPEKSLAKGQIKKYILKNMGAEGSEEAASDLINTVADLVISSDKAELRQRVNELIAEGKSEGEAYGIALMELGGQVALDALGGAISGGVMAGVGVGTHSIRSDRLTNDYNLYNPDVMNEQIQRGLSYDPSTQAYELADRLQNRIANNESINNMERAGVLLANEEAKGDASRALSARISEETPSLDKDVANYISALYDPATNADEDSYLVEANDAYLAGYEGKDNESLPSENLSPIQTDALYELGKQKREEDNELRIRESGERNDSESTREQVQPVEESTGRNQEWKAEIRSGGDSEANAAVFSQSEINIHAPNIVGKYKIVQSSTSKDYNLAVEKAKKAGFKLVGVDGYMQFEDPNTKEISEKGAFVDYDNKTIYASVNSDEYTTSQYVDHELFHNEIDSGRVNLKETLNTVREKMGDVQFDRAINDYANMYEGLYDDLEGDERTEKIFTEMACDSHAGMNVYEGKFTTMAQEYAKTQQTIRENTVYNEDNQANAPPTGVEFSAKATKGEDLAKQNKQLEKEIARISKNAEKWRNETKISNPIKPKEADVNKFTKEFKQRFSSSLPLNTLKKRVDALFKTMLNVDKLSEDARWASIKAMGIDLASDLVNSSEELKVVYPEYEDIQRELMRGVTISDEDKANIPDFNDFRKRNIRNVKIVKEGIAVDSLYQELNQQYPYLFPETLTNPADQLMRMADVAEEIRPDLVNPYEEYGLDMASIIESVANEIIEETYGQIAPYETFADKKATEIKELKTQNKKQEKELDKKVAETDELKTRFKEKAKALRDKRDEDIKSLKKHNAERRRQESNRRKASKLREKITRHAKALSDKLLKPTDKKHITEGREVRGGRDVEPLRRVVAEVLSLINQESSFGYTEEGKRTKDKDRIVFAAKKTEAWNRLLKEYQKIVNDGTYQVDESLEDVRGYISQIAQYAKTPISELGVEQLQTIYDCLRSLENTIEHAEKMLSADKSPAQLAYALKDETKNNKQRVVRGLPLYDNFVMGMVSPQAFFERLGKTLYNFAFKGLRQAQNNFIELTKEFQKWASENIDGKTKYAWEHDEHTVKLGGKEVKMSSAQLMDLYILSNREQGADHIYQGGIELRNKPTGIEIAKDVAKNIKEAFTHTESEREESVIRRITPEEVANACSKLTREQLELAQKMSKYVNEDLSAIGNKASMDVFGYEKFLEGAYWHIKTVASDRIKNNSVTTDALPVSVGSAGFTKPTVENAQSAIYVGSVFTDFMETVVNMNNYASYLAIQEDMKRLLNYKFYDEKGNPAGNVEQILNEVFGQGQGVKYWTKLMSDIASGVKAYDLLQGNMLGKFKSTAVGANLRVIVQQPTAILRALDMLDAKYLAMGMANPLKGSKEAIKYSPLAQWKSWGYFDINTGRSLEDLIYGTPNAFRKAQEYMMKGAAKADDFAWGVLWNAVKAEIKDTSNLKEGSQEFYDAVKERFEDIVDRTQVVDGVLQRSAFLRDGGLYTKMLTAFMGEPIKQYNQFMNTIYKWRSGQAKGADLLRTGTALIAAGTLNALVKSLVDAMRHSKRDKDFWEQYIDDLLGKDDKGLDFWKFMSGNFGEQFDPLTYLPYIRDVESAFKGYTVARTDMAIWTDMIKEAQQFVKAVSGDSKYTLQYATERLILQMSKLFGIPASNLERDVKAVIDTLINNLAPTAVAYKWNRYYYTANNSDNKKMYIKLLREAYEKGDTATYEYILKDLEEQGVTEKSIKTQLDNIQKDEIKKETGAEKVTVKDIENRVSAEIFGANGTSTKVDITDNPTYKEVSSSKIWSQASPAMQQSINEDIANLQSGSNSKLQAQVSKAKSYGKSESDWLLFTLARKVVDANEGNNNQHYDKTEETKAGKMTGFTYEQIKQIKSAK